MTCNIMGNNLGMVRNVNFEFTCLSDPPTSSLRVEIEVNTVNLEIEEHKLLNNVNLDKETITTENLSLKEEIKLLKVQIREQQEYIYIS